MPVKFSGFILLFCLLSLTNYAQKNLKEAVVVLNNADSTHGYIDYKEWLTNPSFILFTTDKSAATRRLAINDVSFFNVIGYEQYRRYTVKISMDNETLNNLGDKDTSSETKAVFLKLLVEGKNVTLFSYGDGLKRRWFLLQAGETTPVELQNSTYMFNGQLIQERQYRATLLTAAEKYLPGDNGVVFQIKNAAYYAGEMTSICLKLNGSTENSIAAVRATDKSTAVRFFVGAGINQGSLKIAGDIFFAGKKSSSTYYPVITAGADIVLKPAVGRIILRLPLHVTSYKMAANSFADYTQYTEEYDFKFKQVNVALVPQLLYNVYNQKQLKWFVSAGFGLNISHYQNQVIHTRRSSSATTTGTNDDYISGLRPFWMNGCLGTGVDISRLQIALAYFPKASITQSHESGIDNTSLQLHVNFYLKK